MALSDDGNLRTKRKIEPAKSTIATKKTKFSGTMKYTDGGHLYMDMSPENVRYFGEPSPEVDQAWAELIGPAMQFSMSREEAEALAVKSYEHPKDGFLVTPDVLHTLHCVVSSKSKSTGSQQRQGTRRLPLDKRRIMSARLSIANTISRCHYMVYLENKEFTQASSLYQATTSPDLLLLSNDSYLRFTPKLTSRVRGTDHCLNHIRQVVQCHMDLTPVTTMYFGSVNTEVGNFEQEHTCRDLEPLRVWATRRKQADQARLKTLGEGGDGHLGPQPLPTHGYVDNEDALLPWNSTLSEIA
ncbi:uncharacterized protein Z519_00640 [Cladophialophora bantiana CBS 173.52]|uniref:Uncharacterized protein n=1 Tax=Cladophialophora bantiana (strain ATCC 10958 / CBS 173.52 / CDC B-1940 / NIH 8579) TaxID=1442370 RepID=A0A0D2GKQ6_CLAB1|nr:uncharacterized protein Z519_00640 [Cladophialophora bantiana CBS 173.52]KIW98977.1 hypothetical protein Z519_00640 [Cladophialophora bantiana CBS 173.52]